MALTTVDLATLRDEIGTATPPSDDQLNTWADELGGAWRAVALRVLKRRRAAIATGEVQSVNLAGAISVSLRGNLSALDAQIRRLEQEAATVDLDPDQGVATVGRLVRADRTGR